MKYSFNIFILKILFFLYIVFLMDFFNNFNNFVLNGHFDHFVRGLVVIWDGGIHI